MLVRAQSPRLTAAQYLELEQISDIQHEYWVEDVYAIASSLRHQIIAGNIYVYLQLKLWDSYKVYADTSVRIDAPLRFYCPDVSVVKIQEQDSCVETYPFLIVEVTSSSTNLRDRSEKLLAYQNLAPLTEYVIVAQDRVQVEVYCLNNQDQWQRKLYGIGESVELLSVGLTVPIEQIYEDICF